MKILMRTMGKKLMTMAMIAKTTRKSKRKRNESQYAYSRGSKFKLPDLYR
jgi:hypothetical protein